MVKGTNNIICGQSREQIILYVVKVLFVVKGAISLLYRFPPLVLLCRFLSHRLSSSTIFFPASCPPLLFSCFPSWSLYLSLPALSSPPPSPNPSAPLLPPPRTPPPSAGGGEDQAAAGRRLARGRCPGAPPAASARMSLRHMSLRARLAVLGGRYTPLHAVLRRYTPCPSDNITPPRSGDSTQCSDDIVVVL